MPAYHSVFNEDADVRLIGNVPLLPLRTRTRGPAYTLPPLSGDVTSLTISPDNESFDPLDEALDLFRANTFFRNFEIKGPADRLLIYGILFVGEALAKIRPGMSRRDAEKAVTNCALEQFSIPGDPGFPLNTSFEGPGDRHEGETLRGYLSQCRQELGARLVERVYEGGEGPSKWWLSFTKRKFMGKQL